jgi:putative intracellular protease/amidase
MKRKKVGENEGPQEQGYGPVRGGRQLVNAIGLDGETVRYVIGSVASASSSAAVAVGSAAVEYVRTDGKDHLIHNLKETARRTAVGTGVVLNVAAGTARIAASGTGAALNFAGSKMMANMTEDDYRENEAETQRVIHAQQTSAVMAQIHDRAYQVQQENQRLADDAANQRKMEEAMDKAQQQELDFQADVSSSGSSQIPVRGAGRRANLQRNLNLTMHQLPPTHKKKSVQHVRNEEAVESFGRKLARGVSGLLGM